MTYDEDLADRLRESLATTNSVSERRMFGGLAFLINRHMAIVASGQGGIMVRVDPANSDRLVETTAAEFAVMKGRPMQGWLRVGANNVRTSRQLTKWVALGKDFVATLPPKT